jgi:hypothetical protein
MLVSLLAGLSFVLSAQGQQAGTADTSWRGVLRNATGGPVAGATVELTSHGQTATAVTQPDGGFAFLPLSPRRYALFVTVDGHRMAYAQAIDLAVSPVLLTVSEQGAILLRVPDDKETTGGVALSSQAVSELPLNKRDFSQLLLLAAGIHPDCD